MDGDFMQVVINPDVLVSTPGILLSTVQPIYHHLVDQRVLSTMGFFEPFSLLLHRSEDQWLFALRPPFFVCRRARKWCTVKEGHVDSFAMGIVEKEIHATIDMM